MASRRYRIYEKALRLRGWPDDALPYIRAARRHAAFEFADNLIGWRRRGLGSMVIAELRHAALGSAAVVAVRGLLPERGRALLRRVTAAKVPPPISAAPDVRAPQGGLS
jgi:hypothetical protein